MIAYFVHDSKKGRDTIYLPDRGCFVPVDKVAMERFIAVKPDFGAWEGMRCATVAPEEFGTVAATRDDAGRCLHRAPGSLARTDDGPPGRPLNGGHA